MCTQFCLTRPSKRLSNQKKRWNEKAEREREKKSVIELHTTSTSYLIRVYLFKIIIAIRNSMHLLSGIHSTYIIICVSYRCINISQRVRIDMYINWYSFVVRCASSEKMHICNNALSVVCRVFASVWIDRNGFVFAFSTLSSKRGGTHRKDNDGTAILSRSINKTAQ